MTAAQPQPQFEAEGSYLIARAGERQSMALHKDHWCPGKDLPFLPISH